MFPTEAMALQEEGKTEGEEKKGEEHEDALIPQFSSDRDGD